MKSADGYKRYFNDIANGKLSNYLLKVLIFTIFETQNHMRTFRGSDKRLYRNELCLDTTNGGTIACLALKGYLPDKYEVEILSL